MLYESTLNAIVSRGSNPINTLIKFASGSVDMIPLYVVCCAVCTVLVDTFQSLLERGGKPRPVA
jgi:hypothetical protein